MGMFEGDLRSGARGVRPSASEGDPFAHCESLIARGRTFEGEAHARRCIEHALLSRDFERVAALARVLRSARSDILSRAMGAGGAVVLDRLEDLASLPVPGFVLIQPPLIGAQGRSCRDQAWARGVAVFLIVREPRTAAGLWPLVAVGRASYRTRVSPPEQSRPLSGTICGDEMHTPPSPSWFINASRQLGQAIIARVERVEHAAWRAEDLVDAVLAHPEDDALLDALVDEALEAARTPPPAITRPLGDHVDRPAR